MKERKDKARHMFSVFNASLKRDVLGLVRGIHRLEGVRVSCSGDPPQPCEMSRNPLGQLGSSTEVIWKGEYETDHWRSEHGLEPRFISTRTRAGVLGVWSSHLDAVIRFSSHVRSINFLLVLEDDVELDANFFARLPEEMARLPNAGRPWHVVRFDTWGYHNPRDEVTPGVWQTYRHSKKANKATQQHSYGIQNRLYGGAHAVLYQAKTAHELVQALLSGRVGNHFDDELVIERPAKGEPPAVISYAIHTGLVRPGWDFPSDRDPGKSNVATWFRSADSRKDRT
uniref:Uncharacterized protein n=1 Tax=Haptolina ericina TaxID=156174 RepID=A0A7S3FP51_9EUKA|mmetsp:Transcript_969/g.2093  ORF Transcript_969/g.2093 Transcript_969/m.2093 type:complete len:284 (+) Transcript_969:222-1073(+)